MKIKYRYICILLISVIYIAFLFIKLRFGELTPDEVLFTSGQVPVDDWSLKYLITLYVISTLTSIHELLFPVSLILFSITTFNYAYKIELEEIVFSRIGIVLTFLFPSVIYFSTSYLRDIFLFLLSILIIYSYRNNKINIWTIIIFSAISILRPEAGLIIMLSFLFVYFFYNNTNLMLLVSKYSTVLVILLAWLVLFVLVNTEYFWEPFHERLSRYEKSTDGFSVFEVDITRSNVLAIGLVNWFAYYASFLFKNAYSLFSYLMLLDSIIVGWLFLNGIFNINKIQLRHNRLYQISYVVIISTFFVSLPESLPETMYRHRMAYLPFLIYLNFSGNEKNTFRF